MYFQNPNISLNFVMKENANDDKKTQQPNQEIVRLRVKQLFIHLH